MTSLVELVRRASGDPRPSSFCSAAFKDGEKVKITAGRFKGRAP